MNQPPYELNSESRATVLETMKAVCLQRRCNLLPAHVRSNRVHIIVEAALPPEQVMNDFKAYASRALNRLRGDNRGRKCWAREAYHKAGQPPAHARGSVAKCLFPRAAHVIL